MRSRSRPALAAICVSALRDLVFVCESGEKESFLVFEREREVRLLHDVNVQIMRRVPGRYILLAV